MTPGDRSLRKFIGMGLGIFTLAVLAGCGGLIQNRPEGDFYTSDLVSSRIAVGPVAEARTHGRDGLGNRRVALSPDEIQKEFAEGLSDIHRAAAIQRVTGTGGPDRALAAARSGGSDILVIPRIEQLSIDEMGRNGLEPMAALSDVLLFPVTIGSAIITRGERGGLGYQYVPIHDVMVSLQMSVDYYRVSDGALLLRRTYPVYVDIKANKDNIEGARLDPTDDLRDLGMTQGRFTVRELARRIAKDEIPELTGKKPQTL